MRLKQKILPLKPWHEVEYGIPIIFSSKILRCRHPSYLGAANSLDNIHFANAEETMWSCQNIKVVSNQINGDYFGKGSTNIYLDHVTLIGNYAFNGTKNIEVHNSTFISKDVSWNCENVSVYDSTIDWEYLAWNSKNIKFINCIIESHQGLDYIDRPELQNTKLIHTGLVFGYVSNVKADVVGEFSSVKTQIQGKLRPLQLAN